MTWAGVRGDGSRPCYSAERPRPDDAARRAEPRAALGNGRGERLDGVRPRRGPYCCGLLRCQTPYMIFFKDS
ncbi:putative atherin-like isoform X1 [Sciurus carolinensis]|uniref:Atherin-like isoform X1 n=1 Tax=Sciurus carolinensis TaxID=30640 RepID=A0AA41T534_SCICA|nr:putative atherin-like isoform X1 [Sciurus carolinensis]